MKSRSSENLSIKTASYQGKNNFIEFEERVRYSEIDRMGVAHNKNYFEWFEIGRTEYCHKKNIPYKSIEDQGYYLVVAEAFCRYKRPLRYDERFLIRVFLKEISPKKVVFGYELVTKKDKKKIATGYTVHIATNSKAEVRSLPSRIVDKLKDATV
jgi:acyl-CoA thioester hydrolase